MIKTLIVDSKRGIKEVSIVLKNNEYNNKVIQRDRAKNAMARIDPKFKIIGVK